MNYLTKIKFSFAILLLDLLVMEVLGEYRLSLEIPTLIWIYAIGIVITVIGFVFAFSAITSIRRAPPQINEKGEKHGLR
jgi:hypothetical protein